MTPCLVVVAKALLVASGPGTSGSPIYADSDRGGSGSPLDGELGLGAGNTLISRFRRISTAELLINDNDDPVTLTLSAYFGSGGAGADLTLYFQTLADGETGFAVSSQYVGAGGGFARFTLPADARSLFDGIATGDRFIFKAARPLAVAVPLAGRLATALTVAVSALDRVAAPVPLAARLAAALSLSATAPDRVAPAAVPLAARLTAALSVSATAPVTVSAAAVPLTGRLAAALSLSATAPDRVAPAAVPLAARLTAALSVSDHDAPGRVAPAAVSLAARLTTALTASATALTASAIAPVAPPGVQQTFTSFNTTSLNADRIRWDWGEFGTSAVDSGLRGSSARYLRSFVVTSDGVATLNISATRSGPDAPRVDLSSQFETGGSITITAGGRSVTLLMGGDSFEPYTPSGAANDALAKAWFAALPSLGELGSTSITLRDFVPILVPLAGRLSAALSVSAAAPVAPTPVSLAARLTAALSVSAVAPRATDASVVLDALTVS